MCACNLISRFSRVYSATSRLVIKSHLKGFQHCFDFGFPLKVLTVRFGPLTDVCGIFARIIHHVWVLRVYSGIHRYHDGHLVYWFIKQLYRLIFHLMFDALISSCVTCLGPFLSQGKIASTLFLSRKDWFFQLYICVSIDTFYPSSCVQGSPCLFFHIMVALSGLIFYIYSAAQLPSRALCISLKEIFIFAENPHGVSLVSLKERFIFAENPHGFSRVSLKNRCSNFFENPLSQ